jgi:hypothetical protein
MFNGMEPKRSGDDAAGALQGRAQRIKSTLVQRHCTGGRHGETSKTCRGDRAWHAWREVTGTLRQAQCTARETHTGSLTSGATARVFPYNRKGGGKTTVWESDMFIVLGGRDSKARTAEEHSWNSCPKGAEQDVRHDCRPQASGITGHGEGMYEHA